MNEMREVRIEETRVYQEAQERTTRSITLKMLRENIDLAMIAEVTGLSIEQIQAIQSENQ
jgi:predicted transposase YdaD